MKFLTPASTRRIIDRLTFPFLAILLALNPNLLSGGELVTKWPERKSSANGLIVATHGWQPNLVGGVDGFSGPMGDLVVSLSGALEATPEWSLAGFRWEEEADTGFWIGSLITPDVHGYVNAIEAASAGVNQGVTLANQIRDSHPNIKKLHLISHSAGAWVLENAIPLLLHRNPELQIEATFLDPFIPDTGAWYFTLPPTGMNKDRITALSEISQRSRLFLLENYYTIDTFTDTLSGGSTSSEFAWSTPSINYEFTNGDLFKNGHSEPICFYSDTIRFTAPPYPDSLDGIDTSLVGWKKSMFYREVFFSEEPQNRTIKAGQTAILSATAQQRGYPGRPETDFNYQWQKKLNGGWNNIGGNQSLIMISTNSNDPAASEYRVTASIGSDYATSKPAIIRLEDTTSPIPPLPPTNLTAATASTQRINLGWSHVLSGASGFRIERRLLPSGFWNQIATVGSNSTTHSDTGLPADTGYEYRVRAFNSAGNSAYSNITSARTSSSSTSNKTLTVQAADISSLQEIGVTMYSWEGSSSGFRSDTTEFTRQAPSNRQITVVAPATLPGGLIFQYWFRDFSDFDHTQSTTVTMYDDRDLIAIYSLDEPVNRTLQSIRIQGPSSVDEKSAASYSARVTFTDGTTDTVSANWSENSGYASISPGGLLDTASVSSDKSVTITASTTIGGVTKTDTKTITIRDTTQKPTYSLSLSATNGHITPSPHLASYEEGTEVRLTAYPDDDYVRSHWSGDASGTERSVYVTMDGNKSVTAHFVLDTRRGGITMNLHPPQAVTEGAGWRPYHSGGWPIAWQDSGETYGNINPGPATVRFKNIEGWQTPENIELEIAGGLPVELNATYVELPGAIQVVITPQDAINVGAQWRLDSGPWNPSGATLFDIPTGEHLIEFSPAGEWGTPPPQQITVTRGSSVTRSVGYTPPAGQPVIGSISPSSGPLDGGTEVAITGANFGPNTEVAFGGSSALAVQYVNASRIIATTPPATSFGTVAVSVSSGGLGTVDPNGFSYLEPLGSNMELIAQIGGAYDSVDVEGSRAYVGQGAGLVIYSLSSPGSPFEIGRIVMPGRVLGIDIDGATAFIAAHKSGVYAVDISDDTSPRIVGFYDTPAQANDVVVSGNLAYVADGLGGLMILDVSDPTAITKVSSLDTAGNAVRITLTNSAGQVIAAMAEGGDGATIIDVTNAGSPNLLATLPPANFVGVADITAAGSRVYTAQFGRAEIFDIQDPSNPQLIGIYDNTSGDTIEVIGNMAYVCDGTLRILDISNPANPTLIGSESLGGDNKQMVISSGYAYVASGQGGFKTASVFNPAAPSLTSEIQGVGRIDSVRVSGNTLVAGTPNNGASIIDVSAPGQPSQLSHIGTDRVSHIDFNGSLAAMMSYGDEDVMLVDLSNPSSPQILSTYNRSEAWDVMFAGSFLMIGTNSASDYPAVDIVNTSNATSPSRQSYEEVLSDNGQISDLEMNGQWLYALVAQKGLSILNATETTSPQLASSVLIDGFMTNLTVNGNGSHVYIAHSNNGVMIVDVSNRNSPQALGFMDTPELATGSSDVVASDGRLFILARSNLLVFDISNPAAPVKVANYLLPSSSTYGDTMQIEGDTVYVAGNSAGVLILRLGDLDNPTININSPTSSSTHQTDTGTIDLGGISSDNDEVTRVIWRAESGFGGVATGTTEWTASEILLTPGINRITVTAEDAAGNTGSDTIEVNYLVPDTSPPVVAITGPTPDPQWITSIPELELVGSATDDRVVASVTWASSAGGGGAVSITGDTWSTDDIPLSEGLNILTVTATDSTGNSSTDSISVLHTPPDTTAPSLAITFPTMEANFETRSAALNISGTSIDDQGLDEILWINHRGGSGIAEGKGPWAVNDILLLEGTNIITVTATDAAGNATEDTLTVEFTPYDADFDGLPDDWEMLHFGDIDSANAETDTGDTGYPDLLKHALGINPGAFDRNLLPKLIHPPEASEPILFTFRRLIDQGQLTYTVGFSENLVDWDWSEAVVEQVGIPTPTGDGITELVSIKIRESESSIFSKGFFSLRVLPPEFDLDGDGIGDRWETHYFGDLDTATINSDTGRNGIPDLLCYAFGMEPQNPARDLMPQIAHYPNGENSAILFKYQRLIHSSTLRYRVGLSENLFDWDWTESRIQEIQEPSRSKNGLTETVFLQVIDPPKGSDSKLFLKVGVEPSSP